MSERFCVQNFFNNLNLRSSIANNGGCERVGGKKNVHENIWKFSKYSTFWLFSCTHNSHWLWKIEMRKHEKVWTCKTNFLEHKFSHSYPRHFHFKNFLLILWDSRSSRSLRWLSTYCQIQSVQRRSSPYSLEDVIREEKTWNFHFEN